MKIGYACHTVGVRGAEQKTCIQRNADSETLKRLISHNLRSLDTIFNYNIQNDIKLFRISSDTIPFGSSPHNTLPWWEMFKNELSALGEKARNADMRLSMHPGQYTVLNSPNSDIVKRAVEDLEYHNRLLDSMGMDSKNKIILHVGGIYGDKQSAIERFNTNYQALSDVIKSRLVIENDDKCYHIADVLQIGHQLHIPVVFDSLHHIVYPCPNQKSVADWILRCKTTWNQKDGNQKIHYSEQALNKKAGSHSATVHAEEFLNFYTMLGVSKPDIMLEVKDKNLSAVKVLNLISDKRKIITLENEWARYKYSVLEKALENYQQIRQLLKDKTNYPATEFYNLVENSVERQDSVGSGLNAAQHVWGYFKTKADEKEKTQFLKLVGKYQCGEIPIHTLKNFLFKLAVKYQEDYLLASYYFVL